jgi:hypothetical protein
MKYIQNFFALFDLLFRVSHFVALLTSSICLLHLELIIETLGLRTQTYSK